MSISYARLVNTIFTSNAYIIANDKFPDVWLVDPGDTLPIYKWMKENQKTGIKGILLTHAHFDHIYGVNDIINKYPLVPIFVANDYGKYALNDAKLNGSKYTENPIIINEYANIYYYPLHLDLWEDYYISIYKTPGHTDDSVCLILENKIFTGDTLIKNVRTVTKLKGGSVEKLKQSLDVIKSIGKDCIILPGHGEEFYFNGYDIRRAI